MGKNLRIKTAPSNKRPLLDHEVSSSFPGFLVHIYFGSLELFHMDFGCLFHVCACVLLYEV